MNACRLTRAQEEVQGQAGASQLKSITGGAGSYTMEYSHDERTPPQVQELVIKAYKAL